MAAEKSLLPPSQNGQDLCSVWEAPLSLWGKNLYS